MSTPRKLINVFNFTCEGKLVMIIYVCWFRVFRPVSSFQHHQVQADLEYFRVETVCSQNHVLPF